METVRIEIVASYLGPRVEFEDTDGRAEFAGASKCTLDANGRVINEGCVAIAKENVVDLVQQGLLGVGSISKYSLVSEVLEVIRWRVAGFINEGNYPPAATGFVTVKIDDQKTRFGLSDKEQCITALKYFAKLFPIKEPVLLLSGYNASKDKKSSTAACNLKPDVKNAAYSIPKVSEAKHTI